MTNNILAKLESRSISQDNFDIVKKILYPNVKDETLLMVIDYCKHRKLDIMKKPVQIVPVWDGKANDGKGQMVDTIWQSITEIRITATRTGTYAGKDDADFGEDITETLGSVKITYPKWCRINVYRLVQNEKCKFSAKIFWKEAYKNAGWNKDKTINLAPNAMWRSRPYAQLEKCVEAAALRAAFPEELGSDYILEENWHEEAKPEIKDIKPEIKYVKPEPDKLEKKPRTEEQMIQDFIKKLQTISTLSDLDKFQIESEPHINKLSDESIQRMKEEIYNQRSSIEFSNISELESAQENLSANDSNDSNERMK